MGDRLSRQPKKRIERSKMSSPSLPTIKRLFALSGNQCAFPRCPLPLVDESSGKVTGRICHIKAQNSGGSRHDDTQSEEERHAFENLLLLCPIHHDVIDSDPDSYTVERLSEIKSEHELKYQRGQEPSDEIASALITMSSTQISEGSLLVGKNQSGGQMAHQINNLLLQPNLSTTFEHEVQSRRDLHDLEIFRRSDLLLDEDKLTDGLDLLSNDHSYHQSFFRSIRLFSRFFEKSQNQYLNGNLEALSKRLAISLGKLCTFLTYNFFVHPVRQDFENTRYCLYPDLNIDRLGNGSREQMLTYNKYMKELYDIVDRVGDDFAVYRKAIKETSSYKHTIQRPCYSDQPNKYSDQTSGGLFSRRNQRCTDDYCLYL